MTRFDSICESITNEVVKSLKEGKLPWERGWRDTLNSGFQIPTNYMTETAYNGFNILCLLIAQKQNGYNSSEWMTYKQAQDVGAHVRKGEKATQGVYWAEKEEEKIDENGKKKIIKKLIPCVFSVFNVDQIDGVDREIKIVDDSEAFDPIEKAERILKNSGAKIYEKPQNEAYYNTRRDFIVLPERKQFKNATAFYDTAFHELGHWTGHESRLNRELVGRFDTEEYAKEELRAELASFFLSASIGIPHNSTNHKAYIKSWIRALESDPKEIYRAAQDAKKIVEYILKFDN